MITEFEEAVDDFCSKIKVKFMLNKKLSLAVSSLTCERVEFVLEWEPDEHTLDDIRRLLEKAFEDLGKRIIVRSIHRGNSIIIICYGPHHLLAALLLEAQDNLNVLMKEFSLIRLTIGHYTVYDKRIRCEVMNKERLAEEIKLADGEEQELRTLLDYKEGSIFEQDKQLHIIRKRKEYIERTLQTPESKLKVKLLTREKLINEIFKSKKLETQYFRTSLLLKAGTESTGIIRLYYLITGREEALVDHKKEIELLQENISITSEQLLMSQRGNIEKKDQCTQSLDTPTAKSIYTACIGYYGMYSNDLSFSEGEELEIYSKKWHFEWKGRSLVSGDEGVIPSSCVYSILESLQLLEFILSVEEVSLPILQKIRNVSSSNDEKASLFLETINDDPIMISALRQDKEKHVKIQCNEVISNINNKHEGISLNSSSACTNSTVFLLSSPKLHTLNLRSLEIRSTPLTNDCIQYLCILLTNNKTIQELVISLYSISDRGVTNICQVLEHNYTLTLLDLNNNPLITSTNISHMKLVRDALKEGHFIDANWFDLGEELNLRYPQLKNIEDSYVNNPSRCLRECLSLWLTSANNRTWESLASALERINQNTAATLIHDDPASQIFQHYSDRISRVFVTDSCIQLLHTEGLITEDTQRKIKRCGGSLSDTLRELMIAVSDDHSNLRSIGNILMELEETKPLAQDIIKDCDELINKPVTTAVGRPVTNSTINHLPTANTSSAGEFFFNAAYRPIFREVKGSFVTLCDELLELISQSKSSAAEVKSFLQRSFPELSAELANADGIDHIMNVVVKNCRVNDISIIKTIVKRFKITEAKPLISEYEEEVKTVCTSLKDFLSQNQPEHFVICETIQFTLGWEPDEHSLDDIRSLLEEAFKELNKRIIVRSICHGNSIIIICHAPHHLLAALLLEAQDSLTVLIKEFKLISLTIGHYTVCDIRIRINKVMNECLAEEIKLADGEEQELRTLLDYKEGSILEQDKQLNIIKESKLKVKVLTKGKLINKIFKTKKLETEYFRTKAGREEALVEYKKEIELLQENITKTSLQLLMSQKTNNPHKFIVSVEEVSLPILQKIRNDSCSNDEKASLFLETINDDPIMISALRQDKEQHDKGATGRVNWDSDRVSLTSPSPVQCNKVISIINKNYEVIELNYSSTNSTVSLLSSTKLHTLNLKRVRRFEIWWTPLSNDCIQYLCILLTNNKTIQQLVISDHSISDRGVTNICQALEHNSTLTSLDLSDNPLITSTSGQALFYLLLNNSSLDALELRNTALSTESVLLILQSLSYNNNIRMLRLDKRHKEICINACHNYHLIQGRVDWD
uniref:SH3 domain-containing protein n=1 Tax=Amphimedon queenslandica TaxID=400682 RepID=A0A1X7TT42_AMPQE